MKKTVLVLLVMCLAVAGALGEQVFGGGLRIENGMMQPILTYSDLRNPAYTNETSDILRFCVYVETDYDTDLDGMADLVKVFVQVPRDAVEGKYRAAAIYDPTPYNVGTVEEATQGAYVFYVEKPFDYAQFYKPCKKREPYGLMSSMDAALAAKPQQDWNYIVPVLGEQGYENAELYNYYLVRGFAIVEASGIGTYGSEGFELCGTDLERDSHKNVVEWLAGNRRAFTDKVSNIEIKADWCNGNVAMTGCSYGGTLPFEVATTGVSGLKTIIPYAGIASWYDYTNSQGVSIIADVNYKDYLSAYNSGAAFLDKDWTVMDENYGSFLWQVSQDEDKTNGDYAPIWESSDYSQDTDNIRCSALIVEGLNDFNVTMRQADLMYRAFKKAGMPVKMVLHQNGHSNLNSYMFNGRPWLEIQNLWLSHYLYGIENGIENMDPLIVQSNIDGVFYGFNGWREAPYMDVPVRASSDMSHISSIGVADYTASFANDKPLSHQDMEAFYTGLPAANTAYYQLDIPENTTIAGVPEIGVRLMSDSDMDGLMISAVLIDVSDDESFNAYMLKDRIGQKVPVKTVSVLDIGGGVPEMELYEHVPSKTTAKCFSFGWTDICNPGCGEKSSDYTRQDDYVSGVFHDYTFYMMPTFYTVAPGHRLILMLMTWDPYRCFLDEGFNLAISLTERIEKYNYSYIVDNHAVTARIPIQQ